MKSDPAASVMLANKWEVKDGQTIVIVNPKLHRGEIKFASLSFYYSHVKSDLLSFRSRSLGR